MKFYRFYIGKHVPINNMAFFVIGSIFMILTSCKKFIEVDHPVNNINAANVYTNDITAGSVITGIYQNMSRQNSDQFNGAGLLSNIYTSSGLSADELILFDENSLFLKPYYTNNLLSTDNTSSYWTSIYPTIFIVNSVIEGVKNSTTLTPAVKQQLLGEAMFLRAFNYFYLVNFYGAVPLALSTDYKLNTMLPRTSESQIYEQIVNDLKEAQELLSDKYLQGDLLSAYSIGTEERVRPTKWAATALLARVYLYWGHYVNAEVQATLVINNTALYHITTLESTFLKNNQEAIWQLMPVNNDINANTGEGKFFILPPEGPGVGHPVYLRDDFINSFEANDLRKTTWINQVTVGYTRYYYPYKYKIGAISAATAEYSTILRLAEVYLIRSEARAQQGDLAGAADDLNVIRNRAGLPDISVITKTELLTAILHERRIELFTEWGHRWFDLKRTGNANTVLGLIKGSDWQATDQLYPIPQAEILRSPSLRGHQNPGYN